MVHGASPARSQPLGGQSCADEVKVLTLTYDCELTVPMFGALGKAGLLPRGRNDRSHRQARRSCQGSAYNKPRPVTDADLKLMQRIDKLQMEFPFAGSRMRRGHLGQKGGKAGPRHVAMLMMRMAIAALYRKPNTSKPAPAHKICSYLLPKLPITRPNQPSGR